MQNRAFLSCLKLCSLYIACVLRAHADISLFFGLAVYFIAFPKFDIWVSKLFYHPELKWPMNENFWVNASYEFIPIIAWVTFFILLSFCIWAHKYSEYVRTRRISLFLFLSLILGPGVLVNNIFKETFERPRPRAVQEFSGSQRHIAAFSLNQSCNNCKSFVSGHASMGFFVMVLAWPLRQRRWLYLGVLSGLAVGGMRVMQGGHFLSDVIFSGFVCYFLYRVLSKVILGHSNIR